MKLPFAVIGWCGWASSTLAATDHFAQRFAPELDGNASYYTVTLPASVYAASRRGDLCDLRVFNGTGEPVSYSLEAPHAPASTPPTLHHVRWFPLPLAGSGDASAPLGVTIAPDGSLRAPTAAPLNTHTHKQQDTDLVDIGKTVGPCSALLVHLRGDYQGRVAVEASDDLQVWQPAGDAQLLRATYHSNTLSQERVALDGLCACYPRLDWLDGAAEIDTIDAEVGVGDAGSALNVGAPREWRERIAARAEEAADEYRFETGGAYPVDRLRLSLSQPNTVAHGTLFSRANVQSQWRELPDTTPYRLHEDAGEQSNPPLDIAPNTDREWRVVVDMLNGGLRSGTLYITAGWRPASLTFAARGTAPFTLAVGNAGVASAALSRSDLRVGASPSKAFARVGAALQVSQKDADARSGRDRDAIRRYVLWAALLFAVGLLAAIAWRLVRSSSQASVDE